MAWGRLALLGVLAFAGCTRGGDRPGRTADSVSGMGHMDSGGMVMGAMQMPGTQMMPRMRAHMDSMTRMSPEQMQGMMASHEAMMSRMLDGMGTDMRGMNMSALPEWSTLDDSVKADLATLPGLTGRALSARMQEHLDRVKRLMAMHERMTRR